MLFPDPLDPPLVVEAEPKQIHKQIGQYQVVPGETGRGEPLNIPCEGENGHSLSSRSCRALQAE